MTTHKHNNPGRPAHKPKPRHLRREFRRQRALIRQEERASRTDEEQLALLEERGHGHCVEAQRLVVGW